MKTGIILGFQSVKYIALVTIRIPFILAKTEEIRDDRIVLKSFITVAKLVAIKTRVILFDFKTQVKFRFQN
jgi:acyl-CoA thioester hydrolase